LAHWGLLHHVVILLHVSASFLAIFREALDKKNTSVASYTIEVQW